MRALAFPILTSILSLEVAQGFAPPMPPHGTTHPQPQPQRILRQSGGAETSSMALHANIVDRFFRVARGNLNSVLQQFENPEKIMDQALIDMQNDIVKVRQTYAEVSATQRRLASQRSSYESVAEDWYRRAQLALKRNNEGLAREALARREQATQQAKAIQQQIDSQAESLDKLYGGMQALEQKIVEAKSKKDQLAARARTAKSTQSVNDMLSGLTGKTSMDAFKRMEDKVMALEAAAEVSAEMANDLLLLAPPSKNPKKTDIEIEFQLLEASDQVDMELEKLKAGMLPELSSASKDSIKIPISAGSSQSAVKVADTVLMD